MQRQRRRDRDGSIGLAAGGRDEDSAAALQSHDADAIALMCDPSRVESSRGADGWSSFVVQSSVGQSSRVGSFVRRVLFPFSLGGWIHMGRQAKGETRSGADGLMTEPVGRLRTFNHKSINRIKKKTNQPHQSLSYTNLIRMACLNDAPSVSLHSNPLAETPSPTEKRSISILFPLVRFAVRP